jgi:hypothetical protein
MCVYGEEIVQEVDVVANPSTSSLHYRSQHPPRHRRHQRVGTLN